MAIANFEYSLFGMSSSTPTTADKIEKKNKEVDIPGKEIKFSSPGSKAQLIGSKESISITHKNNGIVVNKVGTVVDGLFHIGRQPSDLRISTFWTFNNELLTGLPSTTYTPIPVLVYKEPPSVKFLASLTAFLTSLT